MQSEGGIWDGSVGHWLLAAMSFYQKPQITYYWESDLPFCQENPNMQQNTCRDPKEEKREKSPLIRWKPMIYPFLSKNVYFQSISPVNRWEIMSSEYNKDAVPMKYQQHGCHSKTCAMTTPISMPRWMGEISWGPTPRWSYNQQLLIEKESVFLSDDAPHRYPVPVVISKHRYIRKTLDKLRRL